MSTSVESEAENAYRIRAACPDDLEPVRMFLRPFMEARQILWRTRAELAVLLKTGFVVEHHGQVVGFAAIEIYSKKLGEIQCLAVAPEHRGKGLGRRLISCCLDLARERGVMEVMAISASEKLLRDLGFDYSLPDQKRALFYQLRSREEVYRQLANEDDEATGG